MAATHPHAGLDWRMPGYYDAALARWADFVDIDPAAEWPNAAAEHLQAIEDIFADVLSTLASPPQGWRRLVYSRRMISAILHQHSGNVAKAAKRAGPALAYSCELVERCRGYEDLPDETKDDFDRSTALSFYGKDKRNVSVVYWKPAFADGNGFVQKHGIDTYKLCLDYYSFWVWDCRQREVLTNGRGNLLLHIVDSGHYTWGALRRGFLGLGQMAKWTKAFPDGEGPIDIVELTLVFNYPRALMLLTRVLRSLVPAGTFARVQFFTASQTAAFTETLFERVSPDQVPRSIGGDSDEPFFMDSLEMPTT